MTQIEKKRIIITIVSLMTDLGNVNYNSKITTPAKKKRHGFHRNFTVQKQLKTQRKLQNFFHFR